MTTEAKVADIPAIVDDEASRRAGEVAAAAAGQIDDANKTAEALARAAEASHLGTRINSIEEGNAAWRATMEQRLTEAAAAEAASREELKALILANTLPPPPPPPPIVETPENASVEQEPSSKPTVTTPETTQKRRRVLL